MAVKLSSGDHLRVLDGLRGLAIVLVVLAHSGGEMSYQPGFTLGSLVVSLTPFTVSGSLGVEMFFYLSGFVLFLPYARAMLEGAARPTLGHFIERRVLKIVPSYYFAVLIIGLFLYHPAEVRPQLSLEIVRHLAFLHPFWHDSFYAVSSPLWSLGIEVQFYVLFPAIAACMRRRPFLTFLGLVAVGESYRLWLVSTGFNNDIYWSPLLPGQIDVFGLGMISAYLFVRFRKYSERPRVATIATAVAACSVLVALVLMNDLYDVTIANGTGAHFAWHSDHRLVFGAVVAVMTIASLFARPAWRALVGNPVLVWFSLISYNLYMWHVPVKAQCAQTGFPCSSMPAPWSVDPYWNEHYFWSYVVISVGIATLVTFGIERPLLRLGWSGIRRSAPISSIETAWSRRKEPVFSGDR